MPLHFPYYWPYSSRTKLCVAVGFILIFAFVVADTWFSDFAERPIDPRFCVLRMAMVASNGIHARYSFHRECKLTGVCHHNGGHATASRNLWVAFCGVDHTALVDVLPGKTLPIGYGVQAHPCFCVKNIAGRAPVVTESGMKRKWVIKCPYTAATAPSIICDSGSESVCGAVGSSFDSLGSGTGCPWQAMKCSMGTTQKMWSPR